MSNNSSINGAVVDPPATIPHRPKETSSDQHLPTPPRSSNAPSDYSDAASVDSQNLTSPRRRHQRGGRIWRKRKNKGGKLQSVSERELSRDNEPQEQEIQADMDSTEGMRLLEDYDAQELHKAKSSRPTPPTKERPPGEAPKAGTGISTFNLARAKSSGGPPLGITIERPKSTGKGKEKGDEKTDEKPNGESGDAAEKDGETETETRHPVSIRLDINLEVEVFLRAKIKGDVTITFL